MAQMIPDRLPAAASRGEQRLAHVLQNLPDDYIVYYEPVIENRHPDFIVLAPDLGVMVVEVKGWYSGDIHGGDLHDIRLRIRGQESVERHPLRQALEYQHRLQAECERCLPARASLCHADGPRKGRFLFPFGHFALLSNITAEQMVRHPAGDLTRLFPPNRVLTRDAFELWEAMTPAQLRDRIREFFDPYWPIAPLDAGQVDVLRGIIHPEIRIAGAGSAEPVRGAAGSPEMAVLDLRQERNARAIGAGHRVVYGVAGSGKTVLLLARARLLAQDNPGRRVLVLCYNVSLAAHLRAALGDLPNVIALHFDGWCKANGVVRRRGESHESLGTRLRDRLADGYGDGRAFDAVLIDEAQDFDPVWFTCALEAMTDPNDGDLLIVGDRQQGIFGPRRVTWSRLGVHARGRTYCAKLDLDRNYRNAAEILALAARFARDAGIEGDEDGFGVVPVDPAKCLRRTGVRPLLAQCRDRADECDRAVEAVMRLVGHGGAGDPRLPARIDPADPRGVGVLYPRLEARAEPVFQRFLARLQEAGPVVWLSDKDRDQRGRVADPGIKVQTIESAKGLQYRAVVLIWADLLPSGFADRTPDDDAKLMYVALTRPEDCLVVTYSGPSSFVADMSGSELTEWW